MLKKIDLNIILNLKFCPHPYRICHGIGDVFASTCNLSERKCYREGLYEHDENKREDVTVRVGVAQS